MFTSKTTVAILVVLATAAALVYIDPTHAILVYDRCDGARPQGRFREVSQCERCMTI